ncbi:hypothetical protein J6590_034347 [Homalodisca vitripennis]|nr:hypothetical protein J6590_034347 [Homalodisca vitripennis]
MHFMDMVKQLLLRRNIFMCNWKPHSKSWLRGSHREDELSAVISLEAGQSHTTSTRK